MSGSMIINIFGNKHKKNVLISYITTPFIKAHGFHTNHQESIMIAQIFDLLGYNVYVIDYHTQETIDYSEFDVIFGFGFPFDNSFEKKNIFRIYYATGAHAWFQNIAETKRILEVNKKYGSSLSPQRLVEHTWTKSTSMCDVIIVLGNDWTVSTYRQFFDGPIYKLNTTYLSSEKNSDLLLKKRKNEFLWFGSAGLVHKGLDLCIEIFSERTDFQLNICGIIENNFFDIFSKHFSNGNLKYFGFISVDSDIYAALVSQCMFSILPTCSEGQATSLITNMASGLIPITTRYSGIDIEKLGFLIERLDQESINHAIDKCQVESEDHLISKAKDISNYIKENHSNQKFLSNFHNILKNIGF